MPFMCYVKFKEDELIAPFTKVEIIQFSDRQKSRQQHVACVRLCVCTSALSLSYLSVSAAEARWREHLHATLHRLPHRSAKGEGSLDLCWCHRNHKGLGVRFRLVSRPTNHLNFIFISWSRCVFFSDSSLTYQRIILAWSWASTVPAAPSSHPPTTLFPIRAKSWRLFLQVCYSSLCTYVQSGWLEQRQGF